MCVCVLIYSLVIIILSVASLDTEKIVQVRFERTLEETFSRYRDLVQSNPVNRFPRWHSKRVFIYNINFSSSYDKIRNIN